MVFSLFCIASVFGRLLLWCLLVEEITAGYEGPEGNPGDRAGGENSCEDSKTEVAIADTRSCGLEFCVT